MIPDNRKNINQDSGSETELMICELNSIIAKELKKAKSEQDEQLISECIEEIADLKKIKGSYSKEEIDRNFDLLQAEIRSKINIASRIPMRRILAVASIICLVIVSSIAVYAVSPSFREWILAVVDMAPGHSIDKDGITYINNGTPILYGTIEELLEIEQLDIYYPSKLPDGISLKEISLLDLNGSQYLIFDFNDLSLHYSIRLDNIDNQGHDDFSTIEVNELIFYVDHSSDIYTARGVFDQYSYVIQSPEYSNIEFIINHLLRCQ